MQNLNYHLDKATPSFTWAIGLGIAASIAYGIYGSEWQRGVSLFIGIMTVSYAIYLGKALHTFLNDLSETKARSEWEQSLVRTHQLMAAVEPENDISLSVPFAEKRDELVREGIKRGWISDVNARS